MKCYVFLMVWCYNVPLLFCVLIIFAVVIKGILFSFSVIHFTYISIMGSSESKLAACAPIKPEPAIKTRVNHLIDPRSPSTGIDRTPIQVGQLACFAFSMGRGPYFSSETFQFLQILGWWVCTQNRC